MRRQPSISPILAVLALLSCSATARAGDLVVGNLDQPVADSIQILPYFSQFSVVPGETVAQQFQTGPTQTTSLDMIFVSLGNLDPGTDGTFRLRPTWWRTTATFPRARSLTTFTYDPGAIPTSGFNEVRFDPTSSVTLNAGTKYWFVIAGTYTNPTAFDDWGSASIQYTFSTDHSGPGNLGFFNDSNDGGSTWNLDPNAGQGVNEPFLIQVNVPEPASWVLGSIGFSCMLVISRRMRFRRAN